MSALELALFILFKSDILLVVVVVAAVVDSDDGVGIDGRGICGLSAVGAFNDSFSCSSISPSKDEDDSIVVLLLAIDSINALAVFRSVLWYFE